MNAFAQALLQHTGAATLYRQDVQMLQVNLGLRCNLSCHHCHLGAGPNRKEAMSWETMEHILAMVDAHPCTRVDLTGGAPELHPHFVPFVTALRQRRLTVQVRTNLAVLLLPELAGMAEFFRAQRLHLVASLPCYLAANVEAQRGEGTHRQLVAAIRLLNQLGYGRQDDLPLNLVYNPGGPVLPPNQCKLEADYRRELAERDGLFFTNLLTITNIPIGRFRTTLRRQGREGEYLALLQTSFNPHTLDGLMCRHQISIGWDGRFYDCDFNLALALPLLETELAALPFREIVTGDHCLACTAGSGSSCGGALAA